MKEELLDSFSPDGVVGPGEGGEAEYDGDCPPVDQICPV